MNTFTFFKDLPVAAKLTPKFMDAFDRAIPEWLNALLPFYQEAKQKNVDILELGRVILLGDSFNDGRYEKDGLGYYFNDNGWVKMLSIESSPKYPSVNLDWQHYLFGIYPRDEYYSNPMESTSNFLSSNHYLTRYHNQKPPYDAVFNRVNTYYHSLTGDPDVCVSLSHRSFMTFTPKGLSFVNEYYKID